MNLRPFTQSPSHFFRSNQNMKGPPTTSYYMVALLQHPSILALHRPQRPSSLAISLVQDSKVLLRISKNICMPALLFSRCLGAARSLEFVNACHRYLIFRLEDVIMFNNSTSISTDAKPAFQIFSAHTPNGLPGHAQTQSPHASFLFGTGSRKLLGNGRKSIASRFGSDLQDSQGLCLAKIVFYAFASKLDTEVE